MILTDENNKAQAGELPPFPEEGSELVVPGPEVYTVRQCLERAVAQMQQDRSQRCVSLGCAALDARVGGLQRGELTILGGRTSTGKSTFAIGIVERALKARQGVLIISLEDSERLYGKRLLAIRTGIPAHELRDFSTLTREQIAQVQETVSRAEPSPLYLNGRGKTVEALGEQLKAACAAHDLRVVIVDYAQKLTTGKRCATRKDELEHAAHYLSDVAKNLDIATVLVSQLTIDGDEKPDVQHIRDCKTLGNSAENVLLLWRVDQAREVGGMGFQEEGAVLMNSAKVKDGRTGLDQLHWDRNRACFFEPSDPAQYGDWDSCI